MKNNAREALKRIIQGGATKEVYFVTGYNDGTILSVSKSVSQGGGNVFIIGYAENFRALSRSEKQEVVAKDAKNKSKIMTTLEKNLQKWLDEGKPIH